MSEKDTHFLPANNSEGNTLSPERKYKVLLDVLESLTGPEHTEIDPAILAQSIKNTEERIAELKKEFPQLNQ